jgi:hypothetical protein
VAVDHMADLVGQHRQGLDGLDAVAGDGHRRKRPIQAHRQQREQGLPVHELPQGPALHVPGKTQLIAPLRATPHDLLGPRGEDAKAMIHLWQAAAA